MHTIAVNEFPSRSLPVKISTISSTFFGIGLAILLFESIFFQSAADLAYAGLGTSALIGFHLFFSEIWFIFVGNFLAITLLVRNKLILPRAVLVSAVPPVLILSVYSIAFVHGIFLGNVAAPEEFREMVFSALGLPGILYLAQAVNLRRVLEIFIQSGIWVVLVASVLGAHASVLMLSSFFVGYYSLRFLHEKPFALAKLFVALLPYVIVFSKPMLALVAFSLLVSFVLAGHFHTRSRNWLLSRFKLSMLMKLFAVLALFLLVVFSVNWFFGGIIEEAIRYYFLKERVSNTSGAIRYGDWSGGRIGIWTAAVASWMQRPLLGYGLGAPLEAYASGWVVKTQFHNYILQTLHNCGAIGFAVIFASSLYWLRGRFHAIHSIYAMREKMLAVSMLVGVLGVLFYGLYGHSLSFPPAAQFFWFCVGYLSLLKPPYPNIHGIRYGPSNSN